MLNPARLIEILFIEDNECDTEMMHYMFRNAKISNRIHAVTSGEAALDFVYHRSAHTHAVRPDLILLDLNLPQLDGQEVLYVFKKDPLTRSIPIIVMTGTEVDSQLIARCGALAHGYITKPVTVASLMNAMQSIEDYWLGIITMPLLASTKKAAS